MTAYSMGPGITELSARVGPLPPEPMHLNVGGTRIPLVGAARIYVCGITPYDVAHLGHAATFVWADTVAAIVELLGVKAILSRNITDVDDVLTEAALRQGRHYDEFALTQVAEFDRMMRNLRVARPTVEPYARHYIAAVQQLTQALLDVDAAYLSEGTVWFKGEAVAASWPGGLEDAMRLSRAYGDDPDHPAKRNPFDVALWRPSVEGHPAWPSPWGWGRPGWHAECAAMAIAVHGAAVDLLVGGCDLAFPHHLYQSAMVEAVTGMHPFNRASLHVGEVRINGEKMAKSTGNLVVVDDVLRHHEATALRILILDREVSAAWDYHEEDLEEYSERVGRLRAAAARPGEGDIVGVMACLARLSLTEAMNLAEASGGQAAQMVLRALRLRVAE